MCTDILKKLGTLDLTEYAPVPFWSWNNRLERDALLGQIEDMKAAECGGFIIHARTGLTTEYLSEEWFYLVGECLKAARKLKMRVWIYDENGWPSGFVGGKLLEDKENLAPYLVKEEKIFFDPEAYAVFEKSAMGFRRLRQGEQSADGVYYTVYVRLSPANTDILDPKVVKKFIEATHEEYYRRFSEYFGKELVGFFTDEPQYFRWGTPFSYTAEEFFRTQYHEDIADGIIHLFSAEKEDYSFRVKYYSALNRLYTHNFYERLYRWCDEHGCMLTGHSVEETLLSTQMLGCAGCSPSYAYEHIPGIDNLTKYNVSKLMARQVGSVAGQLGKKQVLTESFGCCGYDTTPRELKAIAEKQYVHGVNLLCHHLFAYSLSGQGKTDHPPCFSRHMPWWEHFGGFNRYFARLGWLLANSRTQTNCLVVNPMVSVYLTYERSREADCRKTDESFARLQEKLNRYGILYDIADEQIMAEHGKIAGNSLQIGLGNYTYVVVPACETLSPSTKRILRQYLQAGGRVYSESEIQMTDGVPDDWGFLKSNADLAEIAAAGGVAVETDGKAEYTYRVGHGFEFLYIVNVEREPAHIRVPRGFARADLLSLKTYRHPREFELQGGESILLLPGKGERVPSFKEEREIASGFRFAGAQDNALVLDTVRLRERESGFGKEEPLAEAFDRLLRAEYKGELAVQYRFRVRGCGKKLLLRREKGRYKSSFLNGVPLIFHDSPFDVRFEEADIRGFIREGENEYVNELDFYERPHVFWALYDREATESVRNCLWYDTELENVYLTGDFSVDKDRALVRFIPPETMGSLQEKGFPNFAGKVSFCAHIFGESKRAKLTIEGNFCVAEVRVNGREAPACVLTNETIISLAEGKDNLVEITLISSLRNQFGPFHCKEREENGVFPVHFTMRGLWDHGNCAMYDPAYRLRPFGAEHVRIAFEN